MSHEERVDVEEYSGTAPLRDLNHIALVDASGGAATMSIPSVSGLVGRKYTIIKDDSSANAVTIDPDGAETINGVSSVSLASQGDAVTLVSDGAEWKISGGLGSSIVGVADENFSFRQVTTAITIPATQQMIVSGSIEIDGGTLTIEGQLVLIT